MNSKDVAKLLKRLGQLYPDARCSLEFATPWQLLAATILSAQCTDERVNQVGKALFAKLPTPAATAQAGLAELEELIRPTGFFRNKAKAIQGAALVIVEKYKGQVPATLAELIKLPGVGRKTANVVLGNAFGIPGITVDTHVGRLSRRLGLSGEEDPEKLERDLMAIVPEKDWTIFSHRLIAHGRAVCQARKPKCGQCALAPYCEYVKTNPLNA